MLLTKQKSCGSIGRGRFMWTTRHYQEGTYVRLFAQCNLLGCDVPTNEIWTVTFGAYNGSPAQVSRAKTIEKSGFTRMEKGEKSARDQSDSSVSDP